MNVGYSLQRFRAYKTCQISICYYLGKRVVYTLFGTFKLTGYLLPDKSFSQIERLKQMAMVHPGLHDPF